MTRALWLVFSQVGLAALLLTLLQLGLKALRLEVGAQFLLLTFALTAVVLLVALGSLFVQVYGLYLLAWVPGVLLLGWTGLCVLSTLERRGFETLGPGGTAFLLPFLALMLSFPSSAALKWLLELLRVQL